MYAFILFLGHRDPKSLINYNPTATIAQKEDRAIALQTRIRPPQQIQIVKAGSSSWLECPFGCIERFSKTDLFHHINNEHAELSQSLDEPYETGMTKQIF